MGYISSPIYQKQAGEGRANFQKVISNTCWLFFDKIFRMGVGLFVTGGHCSISF